MTDKFHKVFADIDEKEMELTEEEIKVKAYELSLRALEFNLRWIIMSIIQVSE